MKLPRFNVDRRCPKCGHDDIRTAYHDTAHDAGCVLAGKVFKPECCKAEHLERYCQRCYFKWAESVVETAVESA